MLSYRVVAEYTVRPGNSARVIALLQDLAIASRAEAANLSFEIYQSIDDPNHVVLLEEYVDEVGFREHRESAHFQRIVVGKVMGLLRDREVHTY